jgi:hypothetical protein
MIVVRREMSNIIRYLKCKYCNSEFHPYISFGENENCFDFKWECSECHKENIRHVHAYWRFQCKCRKTTEQKIKKK